MHAFIYTRVSTTEQASDGVSLDAQQAKARQWAVANGYAVSGAFTDAGVSGKHMRNRPGLQAALDAVCKAKGALVVYSLSRMARSTKDALTIAERLDKAGADLVSLTERIDTGSAAGKMVFRMLAVLAEFERDLVSERTKAAFTFMRSKGQRIGEIPFGFALASNGVDVSADPIEQATLADLRSMRAAGATWQHIADELNARGIPTKKGKIWTLHNARKIALAA